MSVFNSTHSIDIVAVYIHLNEFLIGHFIKYDMMRYIPSIYRKFVFCNINTNISIYRKKTRAHVQNRPHVTVGAKIAVLCSRTNIAERTQVVGIIRARFFSKGDNSVFRVFRQNTYVHNGNVEDLGRLPKRRVTTSLQDIQIVNNHFQDRCTVASTMARNTVKSNLSDGKGKDNQRGIYFHVVHE